MKITSALISAALCIGVAQADDFILTTPPESIGKWYQPANERQEWLHNMFNLRRQVQAIRTYSSAQEKELTVKWVSAFAQSYKKIGEMVPEWADELETERLAELEAAAAAGDFSGVDQILPKIGQSCGGCHKEFRAVTAALYRAPNFSSIKLKGAEGQEQDYREFMAELQRLTNSISINMQDDRMAQAISDAGQLKSALGTLKASCSSCHKDSRQADYFLGEHTDKAMLNLETALKGSDKKSAGMALGETALNACAHCHGVHRISYDLSRMLK